jgi:hypothetical protein
MAPQVKLYRTYRFIDKDPVLPTGTQLHLIEGACV